MTRFRVVLLIAACFAAGAVWCGPDLLCRRRLSQAHQTLKNGDAKHALGLLEQLESSGVPRSLAGEHAFLMARTHRHLGNNPKTREWVERAYKLGYSVDRLKTEQILALAQNGQLRECERFLTELLQNPGEDAGEICQAYAAGFLKNYRFQDAVGLLDAWQRDEPKNPEPWYIKGLYYRHRSNDPEGMKCLERVLELNPERVDARMHLTQILLKVHKYGEAERHLRLMLKSDPNSAYLHAGLGQCLLVKNDTEGAELAFDTSLGLDPENNSAIMGKAKLFQDTNRPAEALKLLLPLSQKTGPDLEIDFAVGSAYQALQQHDEAKFYLERFNSARTALGECVDLMDRVSEDPNDIEARYRMGMNLLHHGEEEDGASWLRSVLEIDENHRATHEALLAYYDSRRMSALAEAHRTFLKTRPARKGDPGEKATGTRAESGPERAPNLSADGPAIETKEK